MTMNEITALNHQALSRAFQTFKSLRHRPPRDVLLLSPSMADVMLVRKQFAKTRVFIATRRTWDLNHPFPAKGKMDPVIASNVFHYSKDPAVWFRNVLNMTDCFILQDLVSRRRSAASDGLCEDGDSMRYCYRAKQVESDFAAAYDLSALQDSILFFEEFEGGRNEHHIIPARPPRHYCAVLGDAHESHRPQTRWSQLDYLRFRLPGISWVAQARFRAALHSRGE